MPGRRLLAGLSVVLTLAGACGGGDDPEASSPRARTTPPQVEGPSPAEGGVREWLAVFETQADPNDFSMTSRELIDRVNGAIIESPIGCFPEGLEGTAFPDYHYIQGVWAETEERLDEFVERAGREPIFTGRVLDVCWEPGEPDPSRPR